MFVKVTGLWDNDGRIRAAVEEFIAESLSSVRLCGISQLSRAITSVAHWAHLCPRIISEHVAPSIKKIENEKNKRVGWRRGKFIWQFYR